MRILILSPHTDDAELGAGASLCKFLEQKHEIHWIVLSTAEESLPNSMPKNTLEKEFLGVMKLLGLGKEHYRIFNFQVRRLHEHRQEILEELVKTRKDFSPDLVIGSSPNDHHQDHQVVTNEMIRAFKDTSSIICYELPWNQIQFDAQMFVKLEKKHIEEKIDLLKTYKSQIILNRPYFSEQFILGWARVRGVQVKTEFAEAFEVIKWIL